MIRHINAKEPSTSTISVMLSLADLRHLSSQQFLNRNAGKNYRELFQEAQDATTTRGNYEDEIALWNDVVAMNISAIQVAPAVMNRGNAYSATGDLDKALQDYNEAINLDPKNAGAYVNRALALAQPRRVRSCNEGLRESNHPQCPNNGRLISIAPRDYKGSGKLCNALDDLTKSRELNPKFAGAYMNRGNIYLDKVNSTKPSLTITPRSTSSPIAPKFTSLARSYSFDRENISEPGGSSDSRADDDEKTRRGFEFLAWLRATCPETGMRDGKEAVQLAMKACELTNWNLGLHRHACGRVCRSWRFQTSNQISTARSARW